MLPPKASFPLPNEIQIQSPKPLRVLPGSGDVDPQILMATVVENYGICRENSVAHQELINWIRLQHKVDG